jgi:hypothetical protein
MLDYLGAARHKGNINRGVTVAIEGINIRAVFYQEFRNRPTALLRCYMEGHVAIHIGLVNITSPDYMAFDLIQIATLDGQVESYGRPVRLGAG